MEYLDGVLHEDILIVVATAFYSAAVPAFADSTAVAGDRLVAVCAGVSGILVGIYWAALCGQSEACRDEEVELFLPAYHILCAPSVVWMG